MLEQLVVVCECIIINTVFLVVLMAGVMMMNVYVNVKKIFCGYRERVSRYYLADDRRHTYDVTARTVVLDGI